MPALCHDFFPFYSYAFCVVSLKTSCCLFEAAEVCTTTGSIAVSRVFQQQARGRGERMGVDSQFFIWLWEAMYMCLSHTDSTPPPPPSPFSDTVVRSPGNLLRRGQLVVPFLLVSLPCRGKRVWGRAPDIDADKSAPPSLLFSSGRARASGCISALPSLDRKSFVDCLTFAGVVVWSRPLPPPPLPGWVCAKVS